jgi:membrane protein implicated in regulation of membrane protease activity
MTDSNMAEITLIFQAIGLCIIALAVLLAVANSLVFILRRLARRHAANTDLDLIGRRAVVSHTIRPRKPGQILCQTGDGEAVTAEASSDCILRRGQDVLITSIEGGRLRVLRAENAAKPATARVSANTSDQQRIKDEANPDE